MRHLSGVCRYDHPLMAATKVLTVMLWCAAAFAALLAIGVLLAHRRTSP